MRRTPLIRLACAAVVGMCCGSLVLAPAFAGGVSDQEQTVQQVVAEIERLHQKVDQYNEDIVVALGEKEELDAQIVISQRTIADQQAQLALLEQQLGNVAVSKVMGGGSGALGPLFSDPVALDESLQRDHLARIAVDAGAATSRDYEVLLEQMADEQDSLEDNQARAAALAQQAEDSRVQAEQALEDLEQREIEERNKLGDLIQEEQDRQAAAAAAQYQRDVAAAQKAAADKAAQQQQTNSGSSSSSGSSTTSGSGSGNVSTGSGSSGSSDSGSDGSNGSAGSSSGGGSDAGSGGDSDAGSDAGSGGSVPPVSSRAAVAVNAASSQLGVPYRFATSSPGVSFDCSGLTAYAWGVAGVGLPHQSGQQFGSTPRVPKEQAQAGDLIFYYSPISHVGIYLGGGSMIHAPATGKTVSVTTVRWDRVVGVSRPG